MNALFACSVARASRPTVVAGQQQELRCSRLRRHRFSDANANVDGWEGAGSRMFQNANRSRAVKRGGWVIIMVMVQRAEEEEW